MAKIKTKTKKAIAKRFRWTASGKIKRGSSSRGHLLSSKTRKRKRQLRSNRMVSVGDHDRIAIGMPR